MQSAGAELPESGDGEPTFYRFWFPQDETGNISDDVALIFWDVL